MTTLTTDRLTLRLPVMDDFAAYAAFYASDATAHIGGTKDEAAAWRLFAADAGHWALRGYGWFMLDERARIVRVLGIFHGGQDHLGRMLARLIAEGEGPA